ncbi:DUF6922 domain-containing protein [Flavobacterium hydrophilum]|uniref:DUF6922 domain-containing protein n=1 Tax=Flavobacterium hydrophilum TaxID=2211445 RepID=A0A2V4C785_9FLAO|nr:hypothetical protein [Flavobacterium hydrophilum]PXY46502.1 hypothetical protein DMB68_04835 [Flavobacterium hydrophilum]
MKQENNIANLFPKYLFWDMDCSKLDFKRDKAIIIPRALYATTSDTFEADIKILEKLYSPEDIVKYLKSTKENISNKVCLSVSKRYNVEPFQRFVLSL